MTKYERNRFKPTVDIIKRHYNGRKIIVFGECEPFEELLFKELGIKPYKYMTAFKNKADKNHVFIDDFEGESSEYYIAAPEVSHNSKNKEKIRDMGFDEFNDFVFTMHRRVEISSGLVDYMDEYGNRVHCNRRCKVILGERVGGADIYIDDSCTVGEGCEICVSQAGPAKLRIGKNTRLKGGNKIHLMADSEFIMGNKSTMNVETNVTVCSGQKVIIGEDCMFSYKINIYAGDNIAIYNIENSERLNPVPSDEPEKGIRIGDHVWIGMKAIVLSPAVIGDSCIIGADSIVKGTFSNSCIIAGNPARAVSKNVSWSRWFESVSINDCGKQYIKLTKE